MFSLSNSITSKKCEDINFHTTFSQQLHFVALTTGINLSKKCSKSSNKNGQVAKSNQTRCPKVRIS